MRSIRFLALAVSGLATLLLVAATAAAQHGGAGGHLAPTNIDMALVGKLRLTNVPEGIADVAAFRGHAYLGAWNPDCPNGGVHVVDIRNPASPQKVAFVRAPDRYYVGEGVHVISMASPAFTGDVLLANHEPCTSPDDAAGAGPAGSGGFSLHDVSNPANPVALTGLVGDRAAPDGSTRPLPNSSHSIQGWTAGNRAYAVLVDNVEATDIDIFDITNPRAPVLVSETDLSGRVEDVLGRNAFFHDVQVEEIGGRMTMVVSYWDAGWILLDVTDPSRPTVLADHDFPRPNIAGATPPEGNAHQAFWSSDRRFLVATSEDFAPFRLSGDILSGPFAGREFNTVVANNTRTITPQQPLIGGRGGGRPPRGGGLPTYYVGLACDPLPRAPTPNAIAIVERGTCTFAVKGQNVQNAGYAAGLVFNSAATGNCEGAPGMGVTARLSIPLIGVVPRSLGFAILGVSGYNPASCPTGASPPLPAVGSRGADLVIESEFDAWGYVHLIDAATFREIGQYAVPEALRPDFSTGFGRLSVHEVKTDPRPGIDLAYVSYYDAGARVLEFGPSGIREVASFVDVGGNDFWGTFPHYLGTDPNIRPITKTSERPLLLFSDKDYGLYILRYTGPESAP